MLADVIQWTLQEPFNWTLVVDVKKNEVNDSTFMTAFFLATPSSNIKTMQRKKNVPNFQHQA